ncbi:uncharacterized protein TRIADDRAFT_57516 [Trichoplax adhaerens]|uniref:G-protein coupled receptors family 2 profile 2 domain-containing protein n=1 Tax=Trichoplax adhaerens TaxID=10228 RepID=B3RZN3_TRIAD|nr:hypothetical protein TRIADDRAFT_57516 [Trichoplax adhaerens]EDV23871.1 hypothetical protein TRIADDRAFT_57516 [Trichoplax adhaerens]|eukprot:XP_002113397.1 hypothetical protein TRIADDRAFT_57516 [Trichoplax adhaerens]
MRLAILNRPWISAYGNFFSAAKKNLSRDIGESLTTLFLGVPGNHKVSTWAIRTIEYCYLVQTPTGMNETCRLLPRQIAVLSYKGNTSEGFSKQKLVNTWNRAIEYGKIGPFEVYRNGSEFELKVDKPIGFTSPSPTNASGNITLPTVRPFQSAMRITSQVLGGISLAGCILTFITYIIFRSIRQKRANQIICFICISIAIYQVFNFFVQTSNSNEPLCKAIGILLHFTLLSAIMWMTILAFHFYFDLIRVYSEVNQISNFKFMLFSCSAGFGIPGTLTMVGITLDSSNASVIYHTGSFCWLTDGTWETTLFLMPVLVLSGINLIIFLIIFQLIRRLSRERNQGVTFAQVISLMALVTAFGLAWLFSAVELASEGEAKDVFGGIFIVLSQLQGTLLFFLYCVAKKEVRNKYLELFGYGKISTSASEFSGKHTIKTNIGSQSVAHTSKITDHSVAYNSYFESSKEIDNPVPAQQITAVQDLESQNAVQF